MSQPSIPPTHKQILTPGNILYLFCDFTTPPKEKFLILVATNPGLLFIIVNSTINEFKQNEEELLEAQISLELKDHPCLKHDSFADCSKVIRHFDATEVIRQVNSGLGSLKGQLANTVRAQIREIAQQSRILENRFKRAIAEELKDV